MKQLSNKAHKLNAGDIMENEIDAVVSLLDDNDPEGAMRLLLSCYKNNKHIGLRNLIVELSELMGSKIEPIKCKSISGWVSEWSKSFETQTESVRSARYHELVEKIDDLSNNAIIAICNTLHGVTDDPRATKFMSMILDIPLSIAMGKAYRKSFNVGLASRDPVYAEKLHNAIKNGKINRDDVYNTACNKLTQLKDAIKSKNSIDIDNSVITKIYEKFRSSNVKSTFCHNKKEDIKNELIKKAMSSSSDSIDSAYVLADYLMSNGESERGELIMLELAGMERGLTNKEKKLMKGIETSLKKKMKKSFTDKLSIKFKFGYPHTVSMVYTKQNMYVDNDLANCSEWEYVNSIHFLERDLKLKIVNDKAFLATAKNINSCSFNVRYCNEMCASKLMDVVNEITIVMGLLTLHKKDHAYIVEVGNGVFADVSFLRDFERKTYKNLKHVKIIANSNHASLFDGYEVACTGDDGIQLNFCSSFSASLHITNFNEVME